MNNYELLDAFINKTGRNNKNILNKWIGVNTRVGYYSESEPKERKRLGLGTVFERQPLFGLTAGSGLGSDGPATGSA